MSFLLWTIAFYLFCNVSVYIYSVVHTFETTGVWQFKIKDGNIGVCKIPRYTFWRLFK